MPLRNRPHVCAHAGTLCVCTAVYPTRVTHASVHMPVHMSVYVSAHASARLRLHVSRHMSNLPRLAALIALAHRKAAIGMGRRCYQVAGYTAATVLTGEAILGSCILLTGCTTGLVSTSRRLRPVAHDPADVHACLCTSARYRCTRASRMSASRSVHTLVHTSVRMPQSTISAHVCVHVRGACSYAHGPRISHTPTHKPEQHISAHIRHDCEHTARHRIVTTRPQPQGALNSSASRLRSSFV